jgi:hypothetical protein
VNVSDVASIAESKLALNHPTHSGANDPTALQKAALAGSAGTPSGSNRYVTEQDPRVGSEGGGGAQLLCSSTGASTSATTATSLGTCTIPAGLLTAGARIELQFHLSHEGTDRGFTYDVQWGQTTILSRAGVSTESRVAGTAHFGVYAETGTQYDLQSWGVATSLSSTAGSAVDSIQSPIVIDLRGSFSSSTTDTLTLRTFTVIRYPAVAVQ